jgi:outer membrane protein assembly factor BamB
LTNYCQAAPVVSGNDVIFGAWDTNLRCLDVATGRLKWVWNNGKSVNLYSPGNVVPVVTDDMVIIVAPDRYMTALDRKTGKELWRDNSHKYRESLGVSADGTRVYAKTMEGELVAVDATSREFKELWTVDMGLGYEHAPCIVVERDGVVYAGSRRGILTAVDPVAKTVLWSLPIGVSEINGIDIDPTTGDVWVSLIEGTIYRIEKNK